MILETVLADTPVASAIWRIVIFSIESPRLQIDNYFLAALSRSVTTATSAMASNCGIMTVKYILL